MARKTKRIVLIVGIATYVIGLFLLIFVNSRADNWAGMVSPLLILGGLATIFISLLVRASDDPQESDPAILQTPESRTGNTSIDS